jgi:hypothetical protein
MNNRSKNLMTSKLWAIALTGILSVTTIQAEQAAATDKPSISTTQKMKLTAQVTAIDMEARSVTLRGPQGGERTIMLGEGARRMGEVEVGDIVLAEYVQNLTLEVFANDGIKPGGGSMSVMKRAPESDLPGMVASETTISMATVEEINLEDATFKLKWGEGNIKQYVAQDPENLKKADVGDLVVVTYTEAVALTLQEVPKQ